MDNDGLITAVAEGDDTALRELFFRHAPWLAVRLRSVMPAVDVEDVLQETFLSIWRGAATYRSENAEGWIWGIARRQAALSLRARGRRDRVVAALIAADCRDQADPIDAALSVAELAEAVDALGAEGSPQRETWRLVYVEERTVAEVAELMGVPVGTVKSRAYRVRRLMRAALRRHDPLADGG